MKRIFLALTAATMFGVAFAAPAPGAAVKPVAKTATVAASAATTPVVVAAPAVDSDCNCVSGVPAHEDRLHSRTQWQTRVKHEVFDVRTTALNAADPQGFADACAAGQALMPIPLSSRTSITGEAFANFMTACLQVGHVETDDYGDEVYILEGTMEYVLLVIEDHEMRVTDLEDTRWVVASIGGGVIGAGGAEGRGAIRGIGGLSFRLNPNTSLDVEGLVGTRFAGSGSPAGVDLGIEVGPTFGHFHLGGLYENVGLILKQGEVVSWGEVAGVRVGYQFWPDWGVVTLFGQPELGLDNGDIGFAAGVTAVHRF